MSVVTVNALACLACGDCHFDDGGGRRLAVTEEPEVAEELGASARRRPCPWTHSQSR
jgi:hypothetical protein